jgi:hypothetical protein
MQLYWGGGTVNVLEVLLSDSLKTVFLAVGLFLDCGEPIKPISENTEFFHLIIIDNQLLQ